MQDLGNRYIYLHGFDFKDECKVDVATAMLHSGLIRQMGCKNWDPKDEKLTLYVQATAHEMDELCRRLVGQEHVKLPQHLVDYLRIGETQKEADLQKEEKKLKEDRELFQRDVLAIEQDWEKFVRNDLITKRTYVNDFLLAAYHNPHLFAARFEEHFKSMAKEYNGVGVVTHSKDVSTVSVRINIPYHVVVKLREEEREKQVQKDATVLGQDILKRQDENPSKTQARRRTIRFKPTTFITFDLMKSTEATLNKWNPTKSHSYHLHMIHNELVVRYSPAI